MKSRGYFWSVFPWPEQFFEREDDLDPIASDLMVSIASIILFALCAAAFGYTYLFFSDPSQHTLDQIVSAQTSIDGYTCKPWDPTSGTTSTGRTPSAWGRFAHSPRTT